MATAGTPSHRQGLTGWRSSLLGRDATDEEIRKAYKVYMKRYKMATKRYRNKIKLDTGCQDSRCQWVGSFEACMLHFDHIPGRGKKRNVSKLISIPAVDRERVKCEVVCGNCHARRTRQRLINLPDRRAREEYIKERKILGELPPGDWTGILTALDKRAEQLAIGA